MGGATSKEALPSGPTPFVISLTDGVPGYIPPRAAFAHGGYEVREAHRYYGQPAAFAEGCAERLVGVGRKQFSASLYISDGR